MHDKERIGQGQVLARVIIEMLGVPKDHVENTMKKYVDKLRNDKELSIVKADFAEPKSQGELFSIFVELDIWFKDTENLMSFCFDAMPSSVEIIEPQELKFQSEELSGLLNDLQAKLHQLDLLVKKLRAENKMLDLNSTGVFHNFIVHLLKQGEKNIDEIGTSMGVVAKQLKPFLEKLKEKGVIIQEGDKYRKK